MVTRGGIIRVAPLAEKYVDQLMKQMLEKDIEGPNRASKFLGQIHVESGGFKTVVESLNYATDALQRLFGRHRITIQQTEQYGRNPQHPADQEALANILYGGKWGADNLGNTQPGDGWRFRGRGLKQLTGRDNYVNFSRAWLGDTSLISQPERVQMPDGAVASAIWFWDSRDLNSVADKGSVAKVTKVVNGGTNGLADREKWTAAYLAAFS